MIVTVAWMATHFDRFNAEYFDARLPRPEFVLSRARTRLGQMSCKRAVRWGRTHLYDFRIAMTTYYDMTERQAQNVLLHEMIHYVITYTGLKDTSSHGIVFRGMADNLNRKYGWDIRTMTSTRGWKVSGAVREQRQPSVKRPVLVLAVCMADGKYFLSRVNPRYAHSLTTRLKSAAEVSSYHWYTTEDTYFDSYPEVRSLRGRRISRSDFEGLAGILTPVAVEKNR